MFFRYISILIILLFTPSCYKRKDSLEDNVFYNQSQIYTTFLKELKYAPILADSSYQLVNKNALNDFYFEYKQELFSKGVVSWDKTFDCNRFTQYYAAFAQIKYFNSSWGKQNRGQAIAIGELYYRKDNYGGHAINVIVSKDGLMFIEPQTGHQIQLTNSEKASIIFIRF